MKVISYPAFSGTEADYLRCQIARISAATELSPVGYYIIDGEEGEAEEGGKLRIILVPIGIIINPEFEGIPNDQLTLLANWVHHTPYILPQGRTLWENPFSKPENEEEEEHEEEEDDDEIQIDPESGPTLLSTAQNDEGTLNG